MIANRRVLQQTQKVLRINLIVKGRPSTVEASSPIQPRKLGKEKDMASDPTLEEQQSFYDAWNMRFRNASFDNIGEESHARGLKVLELVKYLGLEQPTILEVGCGTGWLTEELCDFGQVLGVDLSKRAIEIAKSRGSGGQV